MRDYYTVVVKPVLNPTSCCYCWCALYSYTRKTQSTTHWVQGDTQVNSREKCSFKWRSLNIGGLKDRFNYT